MSTGLSCNVHLHVHVHVPTLTCIHRHRKSVIRMRNFLLLVTSTLNFCTKPQAWHCTCTCTHTSIIFHVHVHVHVVPCHDIAAIALLHVHVHVGTCIIHVICNTHLTLRVFVNVALRLVLILRSSGSLQVMRAMPAVRWRTMWWAARCIRWMSGSRAKSWREGGRERERERGGGGREGGRGGGGEDQLLRMYSICYHWFQLKWEPAANAQSIAFLELQGAHTVRYTSHVHIYPHVY